MHIESLREYCLSKKGVEESLPFGPDTLVFKIGQKIFLLTSLDSPQLQFNVKCDPALAEELREKHAAVKPGYHMNKKHWNTVVVDGFVSDSILREWIDHSYQLILHSLPASQRKAYL